MSTPPTSKPTATANLASLTTRWALGAPASPTNTGLPVDKPRIAHLELLKVRTFQCVAILFRDASLLDEVAEDLCASDKTWELRD
jgi:hypothetical protein